jgi:hypothetical protein
VVGEEFTNKIPKIAAGMAGAGTEVADTSDVPVRRGLQAFGSTPKQRLSAIAQCLVNHVGQASVNHAAE